MIASFNKARECEDCLFVWCQRVGYKSTNRPRRSRRGASDKMNVEAVTCGRDKKRALRGLMSGPVANSQRRVPDHAIDIG